MLRTSLRCDKDDKKLADKTILLKDSGSEKGVFWKRGCESGRLV